jgi:hypothetical protein
MRRLLILLVWTWVATVHAQDQPALPDKEAEAAKLLTELLLASDKLAVPKLDDDGAVPFVKLMATYEYAALAAADVATLSPLDQPFQRYVAVADKSPAFYAAFCYGLNLAANRNPLLYRPVPIAGGALLRIDLRLLAAEEKDFESLFQAYEDLDEIDPYYHAKAAATVQTVKVKKTITVPAYRASDGRVYTTKIVEVEEAVPGEVLAPAQHAILPVIQQLHTLTKSSAPLLKAEKLLAVLLSTTNDGRYYQFRGLQKSGGGKTAEQKALELLGADAKVVANLRADERIGMLRSEVTGKPRAIEFFYGSGTRPSLGPSFVAITRDFFEGRIDPRRHPLKNLLDYKHDAAELIGILANGMPLFAVFDGDGELVDSALDRAVTDRGVPSPHSTILQGAISCIRCHGPDDGYKPASNHVKLMIRNGLEIVGDTSTVDNAFQVRQRLLGLYAGDLDEPLRIARTTQSRACWAVTGGIGIQDVSAKLTDIYNEYMYAPVTPRRALRDLGYEASDVDAIRLFNRVVPRMPLDPVTGTSPESIITLALRTWRPPTAKNPNAAPLSINRDDWEQEFQDVMLRVVEEEVRTQKGHPAAGAIKVRAVDTLPAEPAAQ